MEGLVLAEVKRHERYPTALAVGLIGVDGLKGLNTTHGNACGDAVLAGRGRVLAGTVRDMVDSVGRWGGDEFLLLDRETTVDGAVALAERVRQRIGETPISYEAPVSYLRHTVRVTVSVGFAVAEAGAHIDALPGQPPSQE